MVLPAQTFSYNSQSMKTTLHAPLSSTLAAPWRVLALGVAASLAAPCVLAQSSTSAPQTTTVNQAPAASAELASTKKKWSVAWGWNRSGYSSNDIHFRGADHDFTLRNVAATDLQADVTTQSIFGTYLNPSEMTIPQTNFRIAYQYSKDTAFALNLDHMKYVVTPDQVVGISGQINGVAQSGNQVLATNYLNFEHTDGLNIISLEYEKQREVEWFGSRFPSRVFALGGVGIVVPKSNVTLNMLGRSRNDEFHLAGYSLGVGMGLEIDFYKDFFFRSAYKYGYVNLPDVVTSSLNDKASHSFTYSELLFLIGVRF